MKNFLKSLRHRKPIFKKTSEPAGFMEVERAERIFYLNYLREGMTVFDAGANIGEFTTLFSLFIGNGSVHSFEASCKVFERLKLVCAATERKNIFLNHLALSDKSGIVQLNIYDDVYLGFNSQATRPLKNYGLDIEPVGIEKIDATTVDHYCQKNNIEYIDLLKIDVEGAELQVMKGAQKMFEAKRIACLTFEFGQTTFDMGNRPEEIENFLTERNYKIRNLMKNEPLFPGRGSVETARFAMHIATPT